MELQGEKKGGRKKQPEVLFVLSYDDWHQTKRYEARRKILSVNRTTHEAQCKAAFWTFHTFQQGNLK